MKFYACAVTVALVAVAAALLSTHMSCAAKQDEDRTELKDKLRKLSDTEDAFAAVAQLGRDFVVSLTVKEDTPRNFFDLFFESPEKVKGGSGIVVHEEGWVLTNRHVVEGADKIMVKFADGRTVQATEVLGGRKTDLAFVKIPSGGLKAAMLGDSDKIRVGDWAIAIGSPFGFDQTVTVGIISAKGRQLREGMRGTYETFIQTDSAINSGNSGGPLLNLRGEVVGVNTAIYSHTNSYLGIGFAIPINRAKELLAELLAKKGKPEELGAPEDDSGYVGVNLAEMDPAIKAQLGVESGVIVEGIVQDGPAHKAGLQRYDIITSVAGIVVDSIMTFAEAVQSRKPGTEIEIGFIRGNRRFKAPVVVGKKP